MLCKACLYYSHAMELWSMFQAVGTDFVKLADSRMMNHMGITIITLVS